MSRPARRRYAYHTYHLLHNSSTFQFLPPNYSCFLFPKCPPKSPRSSCWEKSNSIYNRPPLYRPPNDPCSRSPAREDWESLSSLATLVKPSATNRADFLQECRSGALEGVKAIYRTFSSVGVTGRIDGEVVGALGKEGLQVGFLCHNGVFDVQMRGRVGAAFAKKKKQGEGVGYCLARSFWPHSSPFH